MANVLSSRSQAYVWSVVRGRFVLACAGALSAGALVAAAALAPSYFILVSTQPVAPTAASAISDAQMVADTASLKQVQQLISTFHSIVAASSTPLDAMHSALQARPPHVMVTHLNYTAGAVSTLILSGTTEDRVALNAYRTSLLDTKAFTSVSIPVNDLVSSNTDDFSITLTGSF